MTITELIKRLQYHIEHGVDPDTIVVTWDLEENKHLPVTDIIIEDNEAIPTTD